MTIIRAAAAVVTFMFVLFSHVCSGDDAQRSVPLLNGKDLTGWTFVLDDPAAKMQDVWHVEGGILHCKGNPKGYLQTEKEYENYVLSLEWRWVSGQQKRRNSGVLVHTSTPREIGIWPKSLEAQLAAENAGDIWVIGTSIDVQRAEERTRGRRILNLTDGSEKPIGEWNRYEITCRGNEVTIKVNGELVNHGTNCSESRGAICLQSEGAPVQFRDIRLTPLGDR